MGRHIWWRKERRVTRKLQHIVGRTEWKGTDHGTSNWMTDSLPTSPLDCSLRPQQEWSLGDRDCCGDEGWLQEDQLPPQEQLEKMIIGCLFATSIQPPNKLCPAEQKSNKRWTKDASIVIAPPDEWNSHWGDGQWGLVRTLMTFFTDTGTYKCLYNQKVRWMSFSSSLWGLECSLNDSSIEVPSRNIPHWVASESQVHHLRWVPIYLKDLPQVVLSPQSASTFLALLPRHLMMLDWILAWWWEL